MNIFINGKPADITLDTEKTLGDVLSGIELWISPTGNRIRNIILNDKTLDPEALEEAFSKDVKEIVKLEIAVSAWRELAAEALEALSTACKLFLEAPFDQRAQIKDTWEKSAALRFLASDIPDISEYAARTFSGEGFSALELDILVNERIREVFDPKLEIYASEALVKTIAARMEELPLDIQTGKDLRAAETVQLFAKIGEKLFRVFFLLKSEGFSLDTLIIDTLPARTFIDDFNAALRELSAAFENKDTVLAGDIAEYELSPRLLKFFTSLKEIAESSPSIMPTP